MVRPDGSWESRFYINLFRDNRSTWHADHDEMIDFQLLAAIEAADWVLWERGAKQATWFLPRA